MRKLWKPVVSLLAAPSLIAAAVLGVALVAARVGWKLRYAVPEGVTAPNEIGGSSPFVDLAPAAALVCAVAAGLAGRWLCTRVRLPVDSPVLRTAGVAGLIVAGFLVASAISMLWQNPYFSLMHTSNLLAVILWAAVFGAAAVAVGVLGASGRSVAAVVFAVVGVVAAWVAAEFANGTPLGTLPKLLVHWGPTGLHSHVVLAVTVFAFGYLLAGLPRTARTRRREPLPSRA